MVQMVTAFSCRGSQDGQYIFSAGCDNKGYMWHVAGGGTQPQQVAQVEVGTTIMLMV